MSGHILEIYCLVFFGGSLSLYHLFDSCVVKAEWLSFSLGMKV